jgi:hypothetical protein
VTKSCREAGEKDLPVSVRIRRGRDGRDEEDDGGEEEDDEDDASPFEDGVVVEEGSDEEESHSEGGSEEYEGGGEDDGEEGLGELGHGVSGEELETLRTAESTMDSWSWWARSRAVRCIGIPASIIRMASQIERDQMEMQAGERRAVLAG